MLTNDNIKMYVEYYITDKSKLPSALQTIAIGDWDVSDVTIMKELFKSKYGFNEPLNWTTTQVTDMSYMFYFCGSFNQPVNFDTSNVTNMKNMFTKCDVFNQPVNFNTSKVTNMFSMFDSCKLFNQPVNFDTSNVIDMRYMFGGCSLFNQPLDFKLNVNVKIRGIFDSCESLTYYMTWDPNNDGNCPNFKQNKKKYIDEQYKTEYAKQKEISQRIKSKTYDFDVPAVTSYDIDSSNANDSKSKGYNPIERERTNISKWLENTENIIVSLNDVQYCISKTWIPNIIKQYTFIQCDETGKLLQQSVTASMKYINLNIIGIEPTCVVPYNEITELLSSSTNRYVLTDTGSKTAVTLEGIYENSTYKKYNPATDNVHKISTAIYIPQQNYTNALTSAISDYTYKWDRRINAYLNSGKTKAEYEVDPVFLVHFEEEPYQATPKKAIELLETKIRKLDALFTDFSQSSNEALIVYRGVEVQSETELRYGLNKAFVSTSTNINIANGFIKKTICCLLELHVAPGIPFLSAKIFSQYPMEDEIILPRDLIYTFKGTKTEYNHYLHMVDVTPSRENQFYQGWRCHDIPIYHLEPLVTDALVTEPLVTGGLTMKRRTKRNKRNKKRKRNKLTKKNKKNKKNKKK